MPRGVAMAWQRAVTAVGTVILPLSLLTATAVVLLAVAVELQRCPCLQPRLSEPMAVWFRR